MTQGQPKPLICIIDRQVNVIENFSFLVNSLDVKLKLFKSAESFIKSLPQPEAACLIIEMNLSGMNGIELLKYLKQAEYEMPVIMLSSSSEVSEAVEAIRLGCIDFMERPFVEGILINRVKLALNKSNSRNFLVTKQSL